MAALLSPKTVDYLLDKLSTDDAFRELFVADPRSALKQAGYETPEGKVGVAGSDAVMCSQVSRLASKQEIQAARQSLKSQLLVFNPFSYFEAATATD